ncbi:retrotransposon protein, putative, ty1-copia subclass [Tanacetum coccineum]
MRQKSSIQSRLYKKHSDVACIMLGKMSPALQRQFENYPPQNMLAELQKMFEKPPAVEIYDLVDALHSCNSPSKNPSLNKDFGDFVRNFNMHCVGKTVTELHALHQACSPWPRCWALEGGLPSLYRRVRANKKRLSRCLQFQNLTSPYTPQQNGVSERRNRTLLDMMRSMFNLTTLQLSFWDYALESAVCILNMVPTKKVDKTPYEIWLGKALNLSYLKVWGCEVYGDFLERDLISQEFSGRDYDLEDDHMDTLPSENTSEIPVELESLGSLSELIPVRRSERTKRAPNRLCLNMEVEDDEDLGEAAYILGIKIYRDRSLRLIGLNQSAYIDKILKKFSMQNSKKGFIPMEVKHDLSNEMYASSDEEKAYMKKVPYASAVGSIMYAIRIQKLDVKVFYVNPGNAIKMIRSLRRVMSLSSMKEQSMSDAFNKIIYLYVCDNSAAIIFANEPGVMKGARHFLRRYHYVREQVESGEIKMIKVYTDKNLADSFTKALPKGKVNEHANGIGLRLASSFMHIL